jgi:hypothetical protein
VENGDIFGFGCESKEDNWPTDTILFSRSAAQGRLGGSLVGCGRPGYSSVGVRMRNRPCC